MRGGCGVCGSLMMGCEGSGVRGWVGECSLCDGKVGQSEPSGRVAFQCPLGHNTRVPYNGASYVHDAVDSSTPSKSTRIKRIATMLLLSPIVALAALLSTVPAQSPAYSTPSTLPIALYDDTC